MERLEDGEDCDNTGAKNRIINKRITNIRENKGLDERRQCEDSSSRVYVHGLQ